LYRESNHDSYDSHLYRTIRLQLGSKNDTSNDSYRGGAVSYRIVRFAYESYDTYYTDYNYKYNDSN